MIKNKTTETEEYRKFLKRLCRNKKRDYIEQQSQNLKDNCINKQLREFYQGLRNKKIKNQQEIVF